jgi:predicted RNA-binding Zn ribbon-like protein
MDFGHYAEAAAELATVDVGSVDTLMGQLTERDWLRPRVVPGDLKVLRRFQDDVREVIDLSVAGDDQAMVERLNALLVQHPVRPRISGHDAQTWHLHVNDRDDSVAAILIGEALFGMTLAVTELGADRFGWCAADSCGNAFFDGTPNHSKRFCSARCATRTNVAAYRQRQSSDR